MVMAGDDSPAVARNMPASPRLTGFTLIELLVVMAIVAVLLTLVVPRYFDQTDQAKEVVLRYNLSAMREAIDRFHADYGRYPASLQEMVDKRYLREIPEDTAANSRQTWKTRAPPDGQGGVYDVSSGAQGHAKDGSSFSEW
jgi:general secretion pathway protein G